MDGSSFQKIVTESVMWPNGLAIDYYADTLYWADAFLDTIEYLVSVFLFKEGALLAFGLCVLFPEAAICSASTERPLSVDRAVCRTCSV